MTLVNEPPFSARPAVVSRPRMCSASRTRRGISKIKQHDLNAKSIMSTARNTAKTKMSNVRLSKAVQPFIKAMDFVQEIISERDEAITKMERMKKWELRPHSRKRSGLPCPRLEFEHVSSEQGWGTRWCMYWLVLELNHADIRAEGENGKLGVLLERYIPMGETQSTGSDKRPVWNGKVETPFRDGAHAHWDRIALGLPCLPTYARCEEDVTLIEREADSGQKAA